MQCKSMEAGQVFSRLTVLMRNGSDNGALWLCRCKCGEEITARATKLRSGEVKSCGCLKKENAKNLRPGNNKTHGLSRHPVKTVYDNMYKRCYVSGTRRYERYGGRGIGICGEWLESREAFYLWALANGYRKGRIIDRIDNDGDYSPDNVRFVTARESANNTSRNRLLTWNGETKTVAQWARAMGVRCQALQHRVTRKWPIEKIFTQPFRSR